MKKIKQLISDQIAVNKMIANLDETIKKAGDDLLMVASPAISVPDARAKILDARLTIDFSNSKRQQMLPEWHKIEEELQARVLMATRFWNQSLVFRRKRIEDEICTNSLPQFNYDETACRNWWQQGHMIQQPVFAKFREAYLDESLLQNGRWQAIDHATRFLCHVEQHAKRCGLETFPNADLDTP